MSNKRFHFVLMKNQFSYRLMELTPEWQRVSLAIGLTLIPIIAALFLGEGASILEKYSHLCRWDCQWYLSIARDGYHSSIPPVGQRADLSNVAFFPGYPYLARGFYLITRINPSFSLLLVSQISCVFFWFIFLLILERWEIELIMRIAVVLLVIAHPASFFLTMGYSEALFLGTFLAFIYYSEKTSRSSFWISAGMGFFMSATRIVGFPLSFFPLFRTFLPNRKVILLSIMSSLGCFSFFLYCQFVWGVPDLYMLTQKIGWGITPDYTAFFDLKNYQWRGIKKLIFVSILGLNIMLLMELIMIQISNKPTFKYRIPFYISMFLVFYITISGLASREFSSVLRYSFVWYIILILAGVHFFKSYFYSTPRLRVFLLLSSLIIFSIGALYQLSLIDDFIHSRWVA